MILALRIHQHQNLGAARVEWRYGGGTAMDDAGVAAVFATDGATAEGTGHCQLRDGQHQAEGTVW
jgi:hypothetical protein